MITTNDRKVVLITGAARRIGAAIARELHASGMNIIVHYQFSKNEAEQLCDELNELRGNSGHALQANLSQHEQIERLILQANEYWGRLDVLVNNASRFYPTPVSEVTPLQWNDLFDINVKAPFFLAKQSYDYLLKQSGCIINIADIHGKKPLKNYSVYSITKAALIMMTQSLAKEFAPNVRVNAISPGVIIWPEGKSELTKNQKELLIQKTLLKRQGTPADIAQAVLFLIHNQYVTGHVLTVDGGRSIA